MNKTIKSALAGSTLFIAVSVALTSYAAAADNNKRKNGTVGIQSVLPKAPAAKPRNNGKPKRLKFVRPKAPAANRDQSRQIVVVPRKNTKPKTQFSVTPKAPPAKKPSRKIAEAKPQIAPDLTEADEAFIVEATKPKVEKKVETKTKPKKKVIKKAPKKAKKKIVKKHKPQQHGTYHYDEGDTYYEVPGHSYERGYYYESEPEYYNDYQSGSSYYSGSSYSSHGYSGGSYSGGYNCQ